MTDQKVHMLDIYILVSHFSQSKKKTFNASQRLVGKVFFFGNDPSAGSPTETLLRLLVHLNDQV